MKHSSRSVFLLTVLVAFFLYTPVAWSSLTVHYLDVGQGDATLFQGGNCTMLIDAGRLGGSDVGEHLRNRGVFQLDLLIGTHPHADHIGQFEDIIENFWVDEVWMPGWIHTTQLFERVLEALLDSEAEYHEPRAWETKECGDLLIEVVNPEDPLEDIHDNVAVRVVYGEVRFLFTGDAEIKHERGMIARGHDLSAEILQLGHHGSRTSTGDDFLWYVEPEVTVYSAAMNNTYGHPHSEVLDRLRRHNLDVYGTPIHGTITVYSDTESYEVVPAVREDARPENHYHVAGDDDDRHYRASREDSPREQTDESTAEREEPSTEYEASDDCVDINEASKEELQRITQIGPTYAERVIDGRPWDAVDELTQVSGIGPARIEQIKDQGLACVR